MLRAVCFVMKESRLGCWFGSWFRVGCQFGSRAFDTLELLRGMQLKNAARKSHKNKLAAAQTQLKISIAARSGWRMRHATSKYCLMTALVCASFGSDNALAHIVNSVRNFLLRRLFN